MIKKPTAIQTYIYFWANNPKRKTMTGRECVVMGRLMKNSVVIKFIDNGQIEIVSRNSLRKPTSAKKGG